ncbi:hypothetical protein ACFLZV_03230 [Candidatus Margulisiibacteriota bacterium]
MFTKKQKAKMNIIVIANGISAPIVFFLIAYFCDKKNITFADSGNFMLILPLIYLLFIIMSYTTIKKRYSNTKDIYAKTASQAIGFSLFSIYPGFLGMVLTLYYGKMIYALSLGIISIILGMILFIKTNNLLFTKKK